ncbi:ABC transporter ATP-binding protein [Microlunatus elymi]|uniref:ABC transporter ATP-binding protein n=1 Tax=Microlunatus elymi TaxID=2596828 RepID=A0A516Q3T5_9ACTN|nr:ABC transporter ATP-binding protein [Microlunatus elymi]QDP98080.1 ABC transporter ATP-binding protein [Microlunatus elymi]
MTEQNVAGRPTGSSSGRHPVLTVSDLTIRFDGSSGPPAVDDVSFTVSHGEVLALVGESGSGKTITARSVLGLLPPTARATGTIRLAVPGRDDHDDALTDNLLSGRVDWRTVRGRGAAMVFQEPQTALNPVRTIGWQLAEALRAHGRHGRRAARDRAADLLSMVELTDTRRILAGYPHQLSGGQKQRIVIALALAGEPSLLIADEPTTALDVTVQEEILALLARLRDRNGVAILLITHNMGVVADLADHVLVLRRGRMVERGDVISLFGAPRTTYTRELLAAVPRLPDPVSTPGPIPARAAADPASIAAVDAGVDAGAAVQFIDVTLSYRGRGGRSSFTALRNVSAVLPRGSVLGVVGESGSGKSTLARTASGTLHPDSGRVLVGGTGLAGLDQGSLRRLRRDIGFVQQDPATTLDPRLTVADCVAEPLQVHKIASGRELTDRVGGLLEQVQLPRHFGRRLPGELSGGQRQRVALARALALRPSLLIADEPTSALDVSVQAEVLALFADLQAELGFACIFISHDLAVVDQISDQVLVMRSGEVVESGPTGKVLTDPATDYTRALLAAAPVPDPEQMRIRRARAEQDAGDQELAVAVR